MMHWQVPWREPDRFISLCGAATGEIGRMTDRLDDVTCERCRWMWIVDRLVAISGSES